MDVTQLSATNSVATAPAPQGTETRNGVISSDFETFLRMLTAQMQNQDPLNPIESTDFATQLATFSSVEQQVLTNDLLTSLGAQLGASNVSQLAGWIGMTGRAIMPVQFDGSPVRIAAPGDDNADKAELVAKDETGREVQRFDISTERQELDWAGLDKDSAPLPPGEYQLSVEYSSAGEVFNTAPVSVEARIVEARNDDGQPVLIMSTGQEVPAGQVLGLRQSQ